MNSDGGLRVLVLTDWFPPWTKGGGPTRTLGRIAAEESAWHQVHVVTRDRDLGDTEAVHSMASEGWNAVNGTQVKRCPPSPLAMVRVLVTGVRRMDILYVNSVHSVVFSLVPLLLVMLRVLQPTTVLIAPRGEYAAAALRIRARKKRLLLLVFRLFVSRRRNIVWHASSAREAKDITRAMRRECRIVVRNDPPPPPASTVLPVRETATLTLLFLARMVPIKNFMLIAKALQRVEVPVSILVAGAIEDTEYWQDCLREVPAGSDVQVLGHLDDAAVAAAIAQADWLLLPTRGENFGHSIAECMAVGVPVAIPDTTLWTPVANAGAGLIIHPDDPQKLADLIQFLDLQPDVERAAWRASTLRAYTEWWKLQHETQGSLFSAAWALT